MAGELKSVAFYGEVPARGELTLVSKHIGTRFVLRWLRVTFPAGCSNLVRVKVLLSPDSEAPTSGEPNGVSVLRDYGQVDYLVGDSEQKWLDHEVAVEEGSSWIKVYAANTDWYPHAVDVQVGIALG